VLKLQQSLPGLRVVYSSATAASDLADMGYKPDGQGRRGACAEHEQRGI